MNKTKLEKYLKLYKESFAGSETAEKDAQNERAERIAYYQKITKEKLLKLNDEEFQEFISKLWASLTFGNKKYLVDRIKDSNGGLVEIEKKLADFIFGKESIETRWDKFMKNAMQFGPSYMSELLSYYYPDECAIANAQVVKALDALEVDNVPHHNYQWSGKNYLRICSIVKEVGDDMKKHGLLVENLLSVDYFLWEVANVKEEAAPVVVAPVEEKQPVKSKSIHDEMIDKIVEIGTWLGFEAEKEVKVCKGDKVDAVWKVKIGNMGMIMYVFEVQSHGSIDSLILNLQRAENNKAVQRLIAVSDEKQLEQIRQESETIKNLDIVLWDFRDVDRVHDNLQEAFSSINKLGLVAPDFIA